MVIGVAVDAKVCFTTNVAVEEIAFLDLPAHRTLIGFDLLRAVMFQRFVHFGPPLACPLSQVYKAS